MEIDPYLINPEKKIEMNGKYKLSWTEDSSFCNNKGNGDVLVFGNSHLGSSFSGQKKMFWFLIFVVFCFSIILGRSFFLQILLGDNYRVLAENNRQKNVPVIAERGLIFDRNKVQLTQNISNFYLTVIPKNLPKDINQMNRLVDKLIEITNQNREEVFEILEKYKNYTKESIVIAEDISYETALKAEIATADLPGIDVQLGSKRLYLNTKEDLVIGIVSTTVQTLAENLAEENNEINQNKNSLSHVLGYVGKLSPEELETYYKKGYLPSDIIGKIGVEKIYEQYLRGVYGEKKVEVNASGKEQQVLSEKDPVSGSNIILSIDINIQNKLEELIASQLKQIEKKRASAIVMNPKNGEILALISYPGFDNNDFSGGIDKAVYAAYLADEDMPLFNRAISGNFPSGSVIKPVISSAALEEKVITENTSFLSTGGLRVDKWFFPDWQAGGHGITNVRRSIAWSVNTFYYYIGGGYGDFVGLGVDKINEYLKKFGFGKISGIDLPSESAGFLPTPQWKQRVKKEPWYIGDTYNYAIGQGDFLTTPLQIANMTASIANGGTLYAPYLVKEIINPETGEVTEVENKILNENFVDQNNLNIIRLGMKDCVEYGSCRRLSTLPFEVAGKTGTAQWSQEKDNHSWFTSFAPFDNPDIVVTVLVEEGIEGSGVATRIVDEFYRWWANYRQN
ncbi:MAG: penicillin-binding protein 2 [Candidatus Magasanikbacteria bacterium]